MERRDELEDRDEKRPDPRMYRGREAVEAVEADVLDEGDEPLLES